MLTSSLNKELARRTGIWRLLKQEGTLWRIPVISPAGHLKGKVGVTDSPECAYYASMRYEFCHRDLAACVSSTEGEVS